MKIYGYTIEAYDIVAKVWGNYGRKIYDTKDIAEKAIEQIKSHSREFFKECYIFKSTPLYKNN